LSRYERERPKMSKRFWTVRSDLTAIYTLSINLILTVQILQ
jgi:hypothetical protein